MPYLHFRHLCLFGCQLSSLYIVFASFFSWRKVSLKCVCLVYCQTEYVICTTCKVLLCQSCIFFFFVVKISLMLTEACPFLTGTSTYIRLLISIFRYQPPIPPK